MAADGNPAAYFTRLKAFVLDWLQSGGHQRLNAAEELYVILI